MNDAAHRRLPAPVAATVAILLAVPVLALLIVGLYAKNSPELWGFPFFYWYQFVWVFLASAFTAAAHAVIRRARRERTSSEGATR